MTVALPGEFGKPRPAVVVQSDLFAGHTTVTVLQAPSCVMVDKTMSVRVNRIGNTIGRLDDADMLRINRAMALFLGIAR